MFRSSFRPLTLAAAAAIAAGLAIAGPAAADRESSHDIAFNKACALPPGGDIKSATAIYTDGDYSKPPKWVTAVPRGADPVYRLIILKQAGRIRLAKLVTVSPSGDWTRVNHFCYRADGSLSHVQSVLRTTHGNVKVIDLMTYDAAGKLRRKARSVYDLKSGKALKAGDRGFLTPPSIILGSATRVRQFASPVFN